MQRQQAVCAAAVLLGLLLPAVSCRPADWLVDEISTEVTLVKNGVRLSLTNGLITREFILSPDFGTVDFRSLTTGKSILRAIYPEAYVTINGTQYPVGGLEANVKHSYLNRTGLEFTVNPNAFHFSAYTNSSPETPFHWEPGLRHAPSDVNWPPKGLTLNVKFVGPKANMPTVYVHYEMYQGIPLLAKWVSVEYASEPAVVVDHVTVEYLATQKPYAPLDYGPSPGPWEHGPGITSSWLYVENNTPHGTSVLWSSDPQIALSPGADEPLLNCSYTQGPGVVMGKAGSRRGFRSQLLSVFESFRVMELVTDSSERERVGLSRHRMVRLLAPQTQENPIFFHATNTTPAGFKAGVDQMAQVGFEMFIFSFGSGFNLESTDPNYINQIAADISYAKQKGIEVGGYDLICLERGHGGYGGNVGDQWDVVDPNTHQLGTAACFASGWYDKLRGIIFNFINITGLSMLETDGPYGGNPCASTNHTHHTDLSDSIYWQNRLQGQLYTDLKELNVFINQPDGYFYQGGNKDGMGYNENQYSLPRVEDLSVSRQGMYDDTYHFLPTQGWMFVPIQVYHGGGAAAEFEPLSQHLLEYEWALAQYLGYGVAACYRGPELYDSPETMAVVQKWVTFYKTYRDILISDIVHVRRPDMQDIDCILHVNPKLKNRGLAMVFNPTSSAIAHNLTLPLYYTGISTKATVLQEGAQGTMYTLDREYKVSIPINMAAQSITWYLVLSAD